MQYAVLSVISQFKGTAGSDAARTDLSIHEGSTRQMQRAYMRSKLEPRMMAKNWRTMTMRWAVERNGGEQGVKEGMAMTMTMMMAVTLRGIVLLPSLLIVESNLE